MAHRGLIRVDPGVARWQSWSDRSAGARMRLCDNAASARPARLLSDLSRGRLDHCRRTTWWNTTAPDGCLCRTRRAKVEVLAEGLQFATVGPGWRRLGSWRSRKPARTASAGVWLTAEKAAGDCGRQPDGFPDKISHRRRWPPVDRHSPPATNPSPGWAHARSRCCARRSGPAPHQWKPQTKRTAWVLAVDSGRNASGRTYKVLATAFNMVTGVARQGQASTWAGLPSNRSGPCLNLPSTDARRIEPRPPQISRNYRDRGTAVATASKPGAAAARPMPTQPRMGTRPMRQQGRGPTHNTATPSARSWQRPRSGSRHPRSRKRRTNIRPMLRSR